MDEIDLFDHFDLENEEESNDGKDKPKKIDKMDISGDDEVSVKESALEKMTDEESTESTNSGDSNLTGRKRKIEHKDEDNEAEVPLLKKRKFIDCSHDICYPRNFTQTQQYDMERKPTLEFRSYEFTLDQFQSESISCIEQGESVLVSAHTSAGKTVVAEYAIAQSLKTKARVVYTSPIKALSNQKYRDLKDIFGDVGLITGDVTISPNSNCLIMTTEILRTMLYKGHELLTSVKWVIYDEVHYLRDSERGVVWEESIILLPNEVKYVFLSATIPNATEFAGWVAELKKQPVHVIYTDRRPTPLKHYAYPQDGKGIYLIRDENNNFKKENFEKLTMLEKPQQYRRGRTQNFRSVRDREKKERSEHINLLLKLLLEKNFHPVIFFSFSRRECEDYANYVKRISFNSERESKIVDKIFTSALENLAEEDRTLRQIQELYPLLVKGIGVHHSGLLPIMKELVEILFSEGFVKVLFATETFAMGLNMPARTCVFTNLEKYDGVSRRHLSVSEYTQMAGRAGRRGIDTRGIVIVMISKMREKRVFHDLLFGDIDPLMSSFHLSYFTMLNLFRVETLDPRYIIDRSFHRYQKQQRDVPKIKHRMRELDGVLQSEKCEVKHMGLVSEYGKIKRSEMDVCTEIQRQISSLVIPYLQRGRILFLRDGWGWCIVLHSKRLSDSKCVIDVLVPAIASKSRRKKKNNRNKKNKNRRNSLSNSIPQELLEKQDLESDKFCRIWGHLDGCYGRKFNSLKCTPLPKINNKKKQDQNNKNRNRNNRNRNRNQKFYVLVICPIDLSKIWHVSTHKMIVPQEIYRYKNRKQLFEDFKRVNSKFGGSVPWMSLRDIGVGVQNSGEMEKRLGELELQKSKVLRRWNKFNSSNENEEDALDNESDKEDEESEELEDEFEDIESDEDLRRYEVSIRQQYSKYMCRMEVESELTKLQGQLVNVGQEGILRTFDAMKLLLQKLGFVSKDQENENVLTIKGKFAAEISNGDCIVLTELLLGSEAANLQDELFGSLLSCFVFEQGDIKRQEQEIRNLPKVLGEKFKILHSCSAKVQKVMNEVGLTHQMVRNTTRVGLSPGLMEVTYQWLQGHSFFQISKRCKVFEGEIIRVMRRLEELLRQISCAVKVVGEAKLEKKMKRISQKLKRDIAFSSSLYT